MLLAPERMCVVLSLIHRRCSVTATGVLLTAVERLADVLGQPMGAVGIRLDLTNERPRVWIDPHVSDADLARFLPEVLAAIVIGPEAARSARQAPKLVAVS